MGCNAMVSQQESIRNAVQTIVLVDDEVYFRQAMKRYLSEAGREYRLVGEAKNGKMGLELIRRLRPDIVLMDIKMPIMDGREAVQMRFEEKISSKVILLTGYSEFEYAHKAIRFGVFDYLLKPIDKQDLIKCLDQVVAQIESEKQNRELQIKYYSASFRVKEHFVNKIFSARKETDWIEVERMAEEILGPSQSFSSLAFLINIYADEENHGGGEENTFYFFAVSNILTELFGQKGIQCFTSNDNTGLCAVVSAKMTIEELATTVHEVHREFLDFIQQMIDHPILISVGTARERLRDLEISVQEVCTVQKFMCMYRKSGICTNAQLNVNEERTGGFFSSLYPQFVLFIRTNNVPAMEALVKEFFLKMAENEVWPEIVLQSARDMVSCAYDVLQSSGGQKAAGESESATFLLPWKFEEGSIEWIQEKVLRYITEVMRAVSERTTRRKSSLAENVARYIEKNYHCYDLSLMELSAVFGMSKTILCQQFKETFKMTIGEYILQSRMIRAKKMLEEGYCNVTYVAEKCGYEDAGYFSKCFKKYFGVSPKDYCETGSDNR